MKKSLLALMLAASLLLSGCALVEKDAAVDAARVIVKVNDQVFTKAEVKREVDYQLAYTEYIYSMYGQAFDITDKQAISDAQDMVIDALIEDAVLDQQVAAGSVTLSDEAKAELEEQIAAEWEQQLADIQEAYFADTELTGDELRAALVAKSEELGYAEESLRESETTNRLRDELENSVRNAVAAPTEEEIQAQADEKAEEDKTTFESNPNAYGTRWNSNDVTLYYRPAGYRLVKQILVKFTAEDQAILDDLNSKISDQSNAAYSLRSSLTDLGVEDVDALLAQVDVKLDEGVNLATPTDLTETSFDDTVEEDVAELAKQLAEANALQAYYEDSLKAATDVAFTHIDERADEVLARLEAGEDWDALAEEYNEDPGMKGETRSAQRGYAVREGFLSFDSAFVDAAMALQEIGDYSGKVRGETYGYYIIRYNESVEEGTVALDEVRDAISSELLEEAQDEAWDAQVQAWRDAAKITIDKKALND